jgi:succinoglycan biosynthesis protein ExoV
MRGPEWEKICRGINFGYIDARWPIEKVLAAIASTEVILTEALHGAIVADALRIPWIPVHSTSGISRFKWQDWCMSVDVEYKPHCISRLWGEAAYAQRAKRLRRWLKSPVVIIQRQVIASELDRIARMASPNLSRDSRIEELTQALEEKVIQIQKKT